MHSGPRETRAYPCPGDGGFRGCGPAGNRVQHCQYRARAGRHTGVVPPDPHTASALLAIATTFNHDFDTGDYGPVWDRWDARSQAVISRAEYIQRNVDCHTQRPLSQTESDGPGPHGAWLVHYEIDGEQLTDYWFYVGYRWVFDLVRSNPDMVPVYRMSPAQYVAAVGCAH
jgi:hypothetical protein